MSNKTRIERERKMNRATNKHGMTQYLMFAVTREEIAPTERPLDSKWEQWGRKFDATATPVLTIKY
jgi:hypothetical protein